MEGILELYPWRSIRIKATEIWENILEGTGWREGSGQGKARYSWETKELSVLERNGKNECWKGSLLERFERQTKQFGFY